MDTSSQHWCRHQHAIYVKSKDVTCAQSYLVLISRECTLPRHTFWVSTQTHRHDCWYLLHNSMSQWASEAHTPVFSPNICTLFAQVLLIHEQQTAPHLTSNGSGPLFSDPVTASTHLHAHLANPSSPNKPNVFSPSINSAAANPTTQSRSRILQPHHLHSQQPAYHATSCEDDSMGEEAGPSSALGLQSLGDALVSTQWCARYSQRRLGQDPIMCQELLHVSDGDQNGVLNYIGTQYGTQVRLAGVRFWTHGWRVPNVGLTCGLLADVLHHHQIHRR